MTLITAHQPHLPQRLYRRILFRLISCTLRNIALPWPHFQQSEYRTKHLHTRSCIRCRFASERWYGNVPAAFSLNFSFVKSFLCTYPLLPLLSSFQREVQVKMYMLKILSFHDNLNDPTLQWFHCVIIKFYIPNLQMYLIFQTHN